MFEIPRIELGKCDGCGLCVSVCPSSALTLVNGMITFAKSGKCDWCTECEAVCSSGAISCPFEIVAESRAGLI